MSEPSDPKNKGGRPRSDSPRTAAQRQQDAAEALKRAGGFRAPVNFSPDAAKAIDVLMEAHGYKDRTETVNSTLVKAASRVRK